MNDTMPFQQALDMVGTGEIKDAKTIRLLQYAQINKLYGAEININDLILLLSKAINRVHFEPAGRQAIAGNLTEMLIPVCIFYKVSPSTVSK